MKISLKWNFLFLLALFPLLIAASDLSGGGCGPQQEPSSAYTLGGTITGLSGTLVLQNNLSNNLTLTADGNFNFSSTLSEGESYSVTVLSNPEDQICTVTNGNGTMGSSNVTDISVICSTNAYTVGGTISGLSGTVVLQNNEGDDLTLNGDGPFTFSTPIAEGAPYDVTVLTQPSGETCIVSNGAGTMDGSDITNVELACSIDTTVLTSSVSALGLSVNDTSLNAALTGNPRLITISNAGLNPASNVTYSPSPALPSGTSISPASCGTIAAFGTCVLTITPGSTASAAAGDTNPTPITLSISGENTNTLTPTLHILSYGSVYQGGYVYAVDDTSPDTGSIGGKVATLTDQATVLSPGIIWSSDGIGGVDNTAIYGISEISTTATPDPNPGAAPQPVAGQSACNGNTNGDCNSNNIYVYYQPPITNPGIDPSLYATGLCKATINGYADWYLPAICEMGFDASSGCGTSGSPTLQNMQSNLVDNGNIGGLSQFYWSSTEGLGDPSAEAWFQFFDVGASNQGTAIKLSLLGVRCSRDLDF